MTARPQRPFRVARFAAAALCACAIAAPLGGCGSEGGVASSSGGRLRVVAAENFWGSIAAQLGGAKVEVRSIITNPATDPHSYEPTASDARAFAGAALAIVNGIGYDEWATRLLQAEAPRGRVVLNVGALLGLATGANPHQWYSPVHVLDAVAAITRALQRLRPADAVYFARRRRRFETVALARYDTLIREIRMHYAGVAVGYSESIFAPLGHALGLRLLTPYGFAKAVAEGGEVTAQEKELVDRQATGRQIAVWVFNSQNVTPDVRRVDELARAARIPIATVTETLSPAGASFQQWQVAELEGLRRALHAATGR